MLKPGQEENASCGLLFWRRYEKKTQSFVPKAFEQARLFGLSAATGAKVKGMDAKVWEGGSFYEEQDKLLSEAESDELYAALNKGRLMKRNFIGEPQAFEASGYLGQYVVLIPGSDMVAVQWSQQHKKLPDDVDFDNFVPLLLKLVRQP